MVHKGYHNPAMSNTAGTEQWSEGDAFNNVQSNLYWSSSTSAGYTNMAWRVNMLGGYVGYDTKDGGSFNSRFGRHEAGRVQMMYGDLYGSTSVFSWASLQFRRSLSNLTANEERTYSKLELQLGTDPFDAADAPG